MIKSDIIEPNLIMKEINLNENGFFENNKKVVAEVTNASSKAIRNKIAGYVTTIMAQIRDSKIQTLEELT